MSHLTCYRLTVISIGILGLNAMALAPAIAAERLAVDAPTERLQQRRTAQSRSKLDIGLQPIIPQAVAGKSIGSRHIIGREATAERREPVGVGLTARVGTLGFGVDVAKSLTPQIDGRLGLNFGNVSLNRNDSGINYDSQLKFSSIQLFGDYYPFRSSGFRLTGGLIAQNNKLSVNSNPNSNGTYTIDGTQYQASNVGTLSGEYRYPNSIAPYLGIGIGKSTNEGLGFNADLGVMFAGAPQVTLNASNPAFNNNPTTRNQLDNQVRQTENDLRGFNVYPVLSVGLSYGF
ncbi:hypothetical protein [Chamaesiphon sp.]|uniref:hypothetical protein n=1 Tax=Chamaesiphon sp. TaxID=2814140 RepID=UPI003593D23E